SEAQDGQQRVRALRERVELMCRAAGLLEHLRIVTDVERGPLLAVSRRRARRSKLTCDAIGGLERGIQGGSGIRAPLKRSPHLPCQSAEARALIAQRLRKLRDQSLTLAVEYVRQRPCQMIRSTSDQ